MRLEVSGVRAGYGGGTVLDGVDLAVDAGQVVAVLGRNGAGKTTLVHAVMGLVRPSSGSVRVGGCEVAGARPHAIARAGVGLVPQGRRIFGPLTVEENLRVAARRGPWDAPRVHELFPALLARRRLRGDRLSGGEQQMLAIGRALVGNPRLLLLDEPSDGLAPAVARQVERTLAGLAAEGVGVLLVAPAVEPAVADEIVVLRRGQLMRHEPGRAPRLAY